MITLLRRLVRTASARRAHAAIVGAVARRLAAVARDDAATMPRRCPVCGSGDTIGAPLVGPLYPFHRCRGCTLRYARRVLRPDVARRLRTEPALCAYRDAMRDDAVRGRPGLEPLAERLASLAPQRGLAVEVGCRYGALVAALAPRFDEAVGLELDRPTAVDGAELFGSRILIERIEHVGLVNADLVVMNDVLEHVADPRVLVSAARRILRPGGVLWIRLPHGESAGVRLAGAAHPTVLQPGHVNLFTAPSLRRLAKGAGFAIERLVTDDDPGLALPELAGPLALPALAVDKAASLLAARTHLPSRLGAGAHLEATLRNPE